MRKSAGYPRHGKQRSKEIRIDAHFVVDNAGVEIDVGIDALALEQVSSCSFDLQCDLVERRAPTFFKEALTEVLEDGRPRIFHLEHAVTKPMSFCFL